jgi:tetratricopeptide (TPR) repeat protein
LATSGGRAWQTLPSLNIPLIGREEEWRAIERAYQHLGDGGVIFISGEPGVGKSRLMQEFAIAQEALLLAGHAGLHPLPYGPLVAALRPALFHPALGQDVRPIWLAEATRLLPELTSRFTDLPRPITVDPQQAQSRLFEALTQLIFGLARCNRLLLCLDDVHWADEATLGWLQQITPRLPGSELVILAVYRTQEADSLITWRRELERRRMVADVSLRGLSTKAITAVLHRVSDDVPNPAALARRIRTATDGNAFFVLEVVRELLETGQLSTDNPELPLPPTVQETVLRRTHRLGPLAQQILEVAAVLAPRLELETLVHASGRSEMEVVDSLEALVSGQLLAAKGEQFRFHHDLARETIYQNIRPWRRRLLHQRAAKTLVRQWQGDDGRLVAAIAGHYAAAGHASRAIEYYQEAAVRAQQLFAHGEATHYLRRAMRLLPAAPDQGVAFRLHQGLAASLHARGRFEPARLALAEAIACLPATAAADRAALLKQRAATYTAQHRLSEAEAALDEAVACLGPEPAEGGELWQHTWLELQLERMRLYYYQQRAPEEQAALASAVQPVVERLGELEHQLAFQMQLLHLALSRERFRLSPAIIEDAAVVLRLALATKGPGTIAAAYRSQGFCALWAGKATEALRPLTTGLTIAEEAGLASEEVLLRTYLAFAYRLLGNLEKTREHAQRCLELASKAKMLPYVAAAESHMAWLAWRQSDPDEAAARAERAVSLWSGATYPFQWAARWVLVALAQQRAVPAEAASSLGAMLDSGQQRLSDKMAAALQRAVAACQASSAEIALEEIKRAVDIARQHGYL